MRHNETHFEQVPLDVVETALERIASQSEMPEKSLALVLTPEDAVEVELSKPRKRVPSKSKP